MDFEKKVFWMRQKYYFDNGAGMTSYLIKVLAVVGIAGAIKGFPTLLIFLFGLLYGGFCYVLGYLYIKHGWFTASLEVGNRLNLFMTEVRKKIRKV